MLQSFADQESEAVDLTGRGRRRTNIARVAARRLQAIDFALAIEEPVNPPGNRPEKLRGDRKGWWSLRINDQYRICFRWDGKDAWGVEIVEYP